MSSKPRRFQPKRGRGNTTDKVDRTLLHQLLWETKDRYGFMTYRSGELAEFLGISIWHMSRILGELVESGKLVKNGSKYRVIDPTISQWTA